MTTGALPSTPANEPLIKSADNVANLIESFIELGVLVHDNQGTPQSNQALMNKLNQLILQLFKHQSQPMILMMLIQI